MYDIWSEQLYTKLLEASKSLSIEKEVSKDVREEINITNLERKLKIIENLLSCQNYSEALVNIVEYSKSIRSKKYINQQIAPSSIAGVFASFWAAWLNQGHAVFDMSPLMGLIDAKVIEWAKLRLSLNPKALGIATNGGSISNLTALNTARNYLSKFDYWRDDKATEIYLWMTEFAHYSIERSAQIIGMSKKNIIIIPTDDNGKIDPIKLREVIALKNINKNSKHILVGTFGNTFNGGFDSIEYLQIISNSFGRVNCWIHIDAAHGGAFFHLNEFSDYFNQLHVADSVVWNPHKMFFQPIPLSLLFFKNKKIASYSSLHDTPYLSKNHISSNIFDGHIYTIECSRTSLDFKLWLTLSIHGEENIYLIHESIIKLSKYLVNKLINRSDIDLYHYADNNIICFRYKDKDISEQIILLAQNGWDVGEVLIKNQRYIRITIMDNKLNEIDINNLINIV
ncbi:pyridoxal phosphate-dependent decarboxylase family protein [Neisseria mucosa]|uniref:pyridoxal phosphate-dependent decarboxylase family protein n=1 Tax=Neisseria mucosa TaxID=488 RepID=UPI000D37924E|nr:pyridoxal-dependent decarboxylase [Neisseria mucosa]